MAEAKYPPEIQAVLDAWQPYIVGTIDDWQALVQGVEPKAIGCGPESIAVADMHGVEYAQPHYHELFEHLTQVK